MEFDKLLQTLKEAEAKMSPEERLKFMKMVNEYMEKFNKGLEDFNSTISQDKGKE